LRAGSYDLASLLGVSRLQVGGPVGLEHLHGIVVSGAVNLGLSGQRSTSFTDPNLFRSIISQRIQTINPSLSWAWDVASFQVTSQQPTNQPPVAQFTFSPSQPIVNQTVTFDGSSSYDPDGFITDWHWVFEGTSRVETHGVRVTVRFVSARTYRVTLTVTDNQGATASTTQWIEVRDRPSNQPPTARFTFSPQSPQVNELVTFDGRSSSDPDGTIISYQWDLNGDGRIDATGALVQARFSRAGSFRVTLTVTDNGGLSDSTSKTIQVGQPPPPPPTTPEGFGFFISGEGSDDQFRIVVQGDPSWTADHNFRIKLRMVRTDLATTRGFTSVEVEVVGNASAHRTKKDAREPLMTGAVRDGKVIYTIGVIDAMGLFFQLELDTDGDGDLEVGPNQIPVFVEIGGALFRVEPRDTLQEFSLVAREGSILPFRVDNIEVCNQVARRCVPLS